VGMAACGEDSPQQRTHLRAAPAPERPALTRDGQLLMEFEALLLRSFKTTDVSSSGALNFNCARNCSPLAKYRLYRFTFSHPAGSRLELGPRHLGNTTFGNYPVPVRVKGRYVSCAPRKYLIAYASAASFTLGCLAGESPKVVQRGKRPSEFVRSCGKITFHGQRVRVDIGEGDGSAVTCPHARKVMRRFLHGPRSSFRAYGAKWDCYRSRQDHEGWDYHCGTRTRYVDVAAGRRW
jgi:hypothetical protein